MRSRCCHVVACLLIAGCGEPSRPESTTADPIGYPDDLPSLQLLVEQRYAHDFVADAWHIQLAGLDAHGNLYVLDQLAASVVALTPAGTSWTIGSEGDGPGELRKPTAATVSGDTLHVMSMTRTSEFLLDGTPVGTNLLLQQALWAPRSLAVVEGGFLVIADRMKRRALLRYDRESHAADTLLVVPYPELYRGTGESWYYPLLGVTMLPPMSLAPSGLAYVSSGSPYEISVWTPTGEIVETRGLNPPPVPVGPVDQSAYEWLMDVAGNEGADRNRQAAEWRDFVEAIVADWEGNVLVSRRDLLGNGTKSWDYLRPDWRAMGRIVVPWNLSIELLDGCNVFGIEVDELGAGTVIRYRLAPCPEGFDTHGRDRQDRSG